MNTDIDTNVSIAVTVIPKPFYETQPMICGFNYTIRSLVLSESVSFNVILFDQFNKKLDIQIQEHAADLVDPMSLKQ
jgi:hypothetical protein